MGKLVTVVVPIYNVERYLDRCISSIVDQTYKNIEIILVDDGSFDNCPNICDEWAKKDSRIKVIHKKNEGLGMARNTGIDYAKGDYICFFDSDDYVELDTIEECVAAACEQNAELVIFGHDEVTADSRTIRTHLPRTPKQLFCEEEIVNKLLPMSVNSNLETGEDWNMVLSAWNKLYSMDVIRKSGWRFVSEREIISEDFYSLTEFHGFIDRVCILNRVFYHYTVNNNSLSRSYKPDRFERIKVFYSAMVSLSDKMGCSNVLEQSIKAISFGLTIGAMKNIVAAKFNFKERYSTLSAIIKDDCLQKIVRTTHYRRCGFQKKILYAVTKYKLVWLCFLLVYLKNRSDV